MGKGLKLPGNMQGLMKQAQKMQEDLKRVQEESGQLESEASAGGGVVRAIANGNGQITTLEIKKEVVDPDDVEMLQDLIMAACNEALSSVKAKADDAMKQVTSGMNIPGM